MINPNFNLTNIPERTQKPRQSGLTMVMDKGLSTREAEDFWRYQQIKQTL
jgi:Uncharacterized conserved protein